MKRKSAWLVPLLVVPLLPHRLPVASIQYNTVRKFKFYGI
jgi:hypothetical protein